MYNKFIEIQDNGDKFLDEDFIMKIFEPLYNELPELETYLTFYFEEKEANIVGSRKRDDCVLAIDRAITELFYPDRMDNKQSTPTCRALAVRLATCEISECIHSKKAIHDNLSEVHDEKSWIEKLKKKRRQARALRTIPVLPKIKS